MLTKQQVYDTAILWIYFQQGDKCVEQGQCAYRRAHENFAARRCVIGMYIHEDLRECNMSIRTPVRRLKEANKLPECLKHFDSAFLTEIQNCHDRIIRPVMDTEDSVYRFFFKNDNTVRFTKQQFFDLCVVHLFAQNGEKCAMPDGRCVYRKKSANFAATRCVLGLFLSDDVAEQYLTSGATTLATNKLLPKVLSNIEVEFISTMQCCHDSYREDIRENLLFITKRHSVSPDMVDALFPLPKDTNV